MRLPHAPGPTHAKIAWTAIRDYQTVSGLIRVALGVCLCLLISGTLADADLWGHLRFGLDLLASGRLPVLDSYSFTSDRPWINHEWLAELLMALAYRSAGAAGLNGLKLVCIATIAAVIVALANKHGATPAARDTLVGLTVLATYTRTNVIRPQMFSVALFCIILYLLGEIDRGRERVVWMLPVCFGIWVNLHGGWILGLGVVGLWFAAAILTQQAGPRKPFLLAAAAIIVATLVNPYGIGLWRFLAQTVSLERADITEWRPLFSLPPSILFLEAILPATALVAVWATPWRVPRRYAVMVLLLVLMASRVGRLDAFAQASIAILLAPAILLFLDAAIARLRAPFWRAQNPAGTFLLLSLVAIAVLMGGRRASRITVAGAWIPDKDAAIFLRDYLPGVRLLTWFDWGEYAIWHLAPVGTRVSIDGRRETVYTAGVVAQHVGFYEAHPSNIDYADRIRADVVWLPATAPVLAPLRGHGWNVAFESPRSLVLTRTPTPTYRATTTAQEARTFPWP